MLMREENMTTLRVKKREYNLPENLTICRSGFAKPGTAMGLGR